MNRTCVTSYFPTPQQPGLTRDSYLCVVCISLLEDGVERGLYRVAVPVSDNMNALARIGAAIALWLSGKDYTTLEEYDGLLMRQHNIFVPVTTK